MTYVSKFIYQRLVSISDEIYFAEVIFIMMTVSLINCVYEFYQSEGCHALQNVCSEAFAHTFCQQLRHHVGVTRVPFCTYLKLFYFSKNRKSGEYIGRSSRSYTCLIDITAHRWWRCPLRRKRRVLLRHDNIYHTVVITHPYIVY